MWQELCCEYIGDLLAWWLRYPPRSREPGLLLSCIRLCTYYIHNFLRLFLRFSLVPRFIHSAQLLELGLIPACPLSNMTCGHELSQEEVERVSTGLGLCSFVVWRLRRDCIRLSQALMLIVMMILIVVTMTLVLLLTLMLMMMVMIFS